MSDSPGAFNGVNSPVAAAATPTVVPEPTAHATLRTSTGDSQKALAFLLAFLGGVAVLIGIGVGGRRYFARRRHLAPAAPPRRHHDGRPAMWDVWLDDASAESCEMTGRMHTDRRWEDIMPVAAWTDPPARPHAPPAPGLLAPSPVPLPYAVEHHIMLSQSWFRGVYPLEHPAAASLPAPEPKTHVAVLVQMPASRRPAGEEPRLGQRGELVFGLADVPCPAGSQRRGEEIADVSRNGLMQLQWMPGLRHDNI